MQGDFLPASVTFTPNQQPMSELQINHTAAERFLHYVTIDTQSDPDSPTQPSTEKQKDLGRVLVQELLAMGVEDAHLDDAGYVYGTIPATTQKEVPVIFFCSHMDTSPDASGKNVKPIVHTNYSGGDIALPNGGIVLKPTEHPELKNQVGNDIITADGTTLLGADNKAGVAEIMDAANYLMQHPELEHGTIKVLFTPDEEIGRGVAAVDLDRLGADFGYTMDGATRGSMEDQTFSADAVVLTIHGVSAHPGYAKGHMQSAIKIAAELVEALPKDRLSPESTEGMEGFVHPVTMEAIAEKATLQFIIRDFDDAKLADHEQELEAIAKKVVANYPGASYEFEVQEQYRNMKNTLNKHPQVVAFAQEAIRRAGMEPAVGNVRGGTDGSQLTAMGLPCPNIFAGEHAFHGKYEWVSRQDMEKAVETIVHLCLIWAEKS